MALVDRPDVVLGRELAEARARAKLRVEAIDLVPRVSEFARARGVGCPAIGAIRAILEGNTAPDAVIRALFQG